LGRSRGDEEPLVRRKKITRRHRDQQNKGGTLRGRKKWPLVKKGEEEIRDNVVGRGEKERFVVR